MRFIKRLFIALSIIIVIAILAGGFCIFWAFKIEPYRLEVNEHTLNSNIENTTGIKIVQFSDLHIKEDFTYKNLEKVVCKINEQEPDIVVFTGDLYDNQDLAETRRPPCSTFKIISSLIALENGIIEPENSTRTWSGEIFWNEDWNKDINFSEAFRTSCVWYFRQVIDDIGKDMMQKELNKLKYGNCDISDWEGRLNTNNNNRALTGFWIESSLLISPKEQVQVMERIFGRNSSFSVKISIPLENTGVPSVFATSVWPFSLIFSLARRNEGNFFQAVPTTLSSSLAEVRLASLVAWA